jgi:hypothetical protein
MTQGKRRTPKEWRADPQRTPDDRWRARAGIDPDAITRGERPRAMPANAESRALQVADALGVPPELLDLGPTRRGFSEAGYRFVLFTQGSDDRGWDARIESWGWPKSRTGTTPGVLAQRFNDAGARTHGPTAAASLAALETELRELIRTTPSDGRRGC